MIVDLRLESLYGQVELVRGAGNRKRGRLCIMSFVAFLAGERHSDDPVTASPVIRRYAMIINDALPDRLRQRLKAFAPRILGTRDGNDQWRAKLLIEAVRSELTPQIIADTGYPIELGLQTMPLRELWDELTRVGAYDCNGVGIQVYEEIAAVVARLITHRSHAAINPANHEWYSVKAIELLDRLCDIGADCGRPSIPTEHVAAMSAYLMKHDEIQRLRFRAVAAVARVCNRVPALLR